MTGLNKADYIAKLITTLGNVNLDIRESAAVKLIEMGSEVVPDLLDALQHPDWRIRQYTIYCLGQIGDVERALAPIIAALNDPHFTVQEKAAGALADLHSQEATGPLIITLHSAVAVVQRAAAHSLGTLKDKRAILPLITALQNPDALVRSRAALALGNIGDRSAVKALCALLNDPHDWTRGQAAEALGMLASPKAYNDLITVLEGSEGHWSRCYAAWALGEIGDKRAIDALVATANTPDVFLKRHCLKALRKLGYKNTGRLH